MNAEAENRAKSWFVRHEGVPMGPFPGSKIRHLLLEGELELDDEISEDRRHWQRMAEVPEVVPLPLRAEAGDAAAQAILNQRQLSEASRAADERRIPWLPIGISLGVVAAILGLALWVGMPEAVDTPQCDAAPAPGVNWRNCLLPGVDVGSASLAGANLNSAVLREAKLSATDLSGADLRYADLRDADLHYADLRQARLLGANLRAVDLRGGNLAGADLRYADLTASLIEGAEFDGARLGNTRWPDGTTCAERSVGQCLKPTP